MKVLIKKAHIICSSSPFHGQLKDILIADGLIQQISDNIAENADEIIANDNLHVSLGWMDIFAHFNDPGYEQKETIERGSAAAAAGGFTDLMILPNTSPATSTKAQVEYIIQKAAALPVNIYPIASITKNAEGKELAEMYDMHASGAMAFTDGTQPVQSPGVLLKALQYVLTVDGVIIQLPDDKSISAHGLMNEGIASTRLGLPGKPAIAEELMIARDIELLKYTRSKLHITGVSTRKGIELIEKAKQAGLGLTASVTPYHCYFCDEDLERYDTNLKVNPPLRTKDDMMAVRDALCKGIIDCIASHHIPQHWDDKTCEFEYAKNGMTGLESLFGVINGFEKDINALISQLTIAPRKIFNVSLPEIKEGAAACLTLFDPEQTYTFDESMVKSKSRNNPFIGKQLKGKVIGIINKNRTVINER
jgi:dihydroorotase